MDVSFIAHGMPQLRVPAGDVILGALQSGLYNSFIGFSAFVSTGGVNNLKDGITSFISNGGSVSLSMWELTCTPHQKKPLRL